MRMPSSSRPAKGPRAPRIIKRYANRKLYDTEESAYVTLDEIADAIRMGEEVRIIDNKTQEDLTSVTLTQIIFEQEKKVSLMPIGMLLDLIRSRGAQISDSLQSSVKQVTSYAGGLYAKKSRTSHAGTPAIASSNSAEANKKKASQLQTKVDQSKELLTQIQKSVDDWHRQLDSSVQQTVGRLSALPTLAKEMSALEKRIRELEARLEDLDLE
ncbi:MAG: transcriptional regulator [Myxococcales bacterium]|jgi:polyhydroxyalkanoate synthesis repressor PhaR|nr:transcriptional regulator [Myxococcales bacterium]